MGQSYMVKFEYSAKNWMIQIAENSSRFYKNRWNVMKYGRIFPLVQQMEIKNHHTILGLKTDLGKWGITAEYCYFDIFEKLDEHELENYMVLIRRIEEDSTNCSDREHEYTFISLVIVTSSFNDRSLRKKLKRFRADKQFKSEDNQYGWSSCRLCVADIENGEYYCSAMGDSVRNRLLGQNFNSPVLLNRIKNQLFRRH